MEGSELRPHGAEQQTSDRIVPEAVLLVPDESGTNTPLQDDVERTDSHSRLVGALSAEALAAVEDQMWGDDPRLALAAVRDGTVTRANPEQLSDSRERYVSATGVEVVINRAYPDQVLVESVANELERDGGRGLYALSSPQEEVSYYDTADVTHWYYEPDGSLAIKVVSAPERAQAEVIDMALSNRVVAAMESPDARAIAAESGFAHIEVMRPLATALSVNETGQQTQVVVYDRPDGFEHFDVNHIDLLMPLADRLGEVMIVNGLSVQGVHVVNLRPVGDTLNVVVTGGYDVLETVPVPVEPGGILASADGQWERAAATELDEGVHVFEVKAGTEALARGRGGEDSPVLEANLAQGAVVTLWNPLTRASGMVYLDAVHMYQPVVGSFLDAVPGLDTEGTLAHVIIDSRYDEDRLASILPGASTTERLIVNTLYNRQTVPFVRHFAHNAPMQVSLDSATGQVEVISRSGGEQLYGHTPPKPAGARI